MSISPCGKLARRAYRPGQEVSVLAMGGLVVAGLAQPQADRLVSKSVDQGVTYFDVAPTYGDAEDRLGAALKPYRAGVFLACKTTERSAHGAAGQLEASLRRLRTDHVDLYQFHGIANMEDVRQILAPGGAAEAFEAARQAGKARFLGFSAHSTEAALAMMEGMPLDSVMFPVNFACWTRGGFGPQVVAAARRRGMACVAIKALARCPADKTRPAYDKCWYSPLDEPRQMELALRFTLSQDVVTAIPPGNEKIYEMALDIAGRADISLPLNPAETDELIVAAGALEPVFRA